MLFSFAANIDDENMDQLLHLKPKQCLPEWTKYIIFFLLDLYFNYCDKAHEEMTCN